MGGVWAQTQARWTTTTVEWTAPPTTCWTPYPKQQQATVLAQSVFELLYGGAAGGGKSQFLRSYAVDFALTHPGAHIALVRRTLPRLKQTHGLHMTALIGDQLDRVNRTENTWTLRNGSIIRFIGLQNDGDEQDYKSVEFDLLCFDEVTELLEGQYTFMLTRLRSARGYRAHVIASANPEGRGFRWVKRRWVSPRVTDLAPGQPAPVAFTPWAPPIVEGSDVIGEQPSRAFCPASIWDNPGLIAANPQYVQQLRSLPDGRMRRALLDGDWDAMDQVPGALWAQTLLDEHRVAQAPQMTRVVVGVDPSGSSHDGSDECGIIAVGKGNDGRFYVLRDASGVVAPDVWAARTVVLYDEVEADKVVAEKNFGADMVISTLHHARTTLPVEAVTASRGKAVRAEPISYLYSQGRVSHVGQLLELEDELTTWTPDSGWSPGRLDALVWALTDLALGGALDYLNAMARMCPSCGLPNTSGAVQCFRCHADMAA